MKSNPDSKKAKKKSEENAESEEAAEAKPQSEAPSKPPPAAKAAKKSSGDSVAYGVLAALCGAGLIAVLANNRADTTTGADASVDAASSSSAARAHLPPEEMTTEDLAIGSGAVAELGDLVSVHYVGTLENGLEFDASRTHGKPFDFRIGLHQVIKGWEQGVPGMKVGGKRKLVIPPDLAYGKRGSPPVIPAEATLTFVIELLDVKKGNEKPEVPDAGPPFTLAEATKGIPGTGPLVATIKTGKGTMKCKLYDDKAPLTVANFVGLATGKRKWKNPSGEWVTKPAYDGTVFHRVIKGFMIQGGDPKGNGSGEPGYTVPDEIWTGSTHDRAGLLCMANRGPNTNGSQFFITDAATTRLDGNYTIFGECAPEQVIHDIAALPGKGDKPDAPVTVEKVTISR